MRTCALLVLLVASFGTSADAEYAQRYRAILAALTDDVPKFDCEKPTTHDSRYSYATTTNYSEYSWAKCNIRYYKQLKGFEDLLVASLRYELTVPQSQVIAERIAWLKQVFEDPDQPLPMGTTPKKLTDAELEALLPPIHPTILAALSYEVPAQPCTFPNPKLSGARLERALKRHAKCVPRFQQSLREDISLLEAALALDSTDEEAAMIRAKIEQLQIFHDQLSTANDPMQTE